MLMLTEGLTQMLVLIDCLAAHLCMGRTFWQETDYFQLCGWLKTCFIIVDRVLSMQRNCDSLHQW